MIDDVMYRELSAEILIHSRIQFNILLVTHLTITFSSCYVPYYYKH